MNAVIGKGVALTLRSIGVFPMTQHVECVALLRSLLLRLWGAIHDDASDLRRLVIVLVPLGCGDLPRVFPKYSDNWAQIGVKVARKA